MLDRISDASAALQFCTDKIVPHPHGPTGSERAIGQHECPMDAGRSYWPDPFHVINPGKATATESHLFSLHCDAVPRRMWPTQQSKCSISNDQGTPSCNRSVHLRATLQRHRGIQTTLTALRAHAAWPPVTRDATVYTRTWTETPTSVQLPMSHRDEAPSR